MPQVNPEILSWARVTAGLSLETAAQKLDLRDTKNGTAVEKLIALEAGNDTPSRPLLKRMAAQYRRPLVAFYMSAPPPRGDRGEDFRSVVDRDRTADPLVDALVRDVRARQSMVKAVLMDDEDTRPLPFIGSLAMADGEGQVLASMRRTLSLDLSDFRAQASPESAFALLRSKVEAAGVFVLLIGNLGSHHTAIDVEFFRGFALADDVAPFVVINDQDAKSAWSFTLLHELAHLWLGATGISGTVPASRIERFCNDVASSFLLPDQEIALIGIDRDASIDDLGERIQDFAVERHLSRTMVAYRALRSGLIREETWAALARLFRQQWQQGRDAQRERARLRESGPNYYVVRRHRLGAALLRFVARNMSEGTLTPTKAGKVLGVKPRSVQPLLTGLAA